MGSRSRDPRLIERDRLLVRERRKGKSYRSLMREFGVSMSTLRDAFVRAGLIGAIRPGPFQVTLPPPPEGVLTRNDRIREAVRSGRRPPEVGREFGISAARAYQIVTRRSRERVASRQSTPDPSPQSGPPTNRGMRCHDCGDGPALSEGPETGLYEEDGELRYLCGSCWLKANYAGAGGEPR